MFLSETVLSQSLLLGGGLLVAILGAAMLTGISRRAALRFGWMDNPNGRSAHQAPTPRIGGIGIVGGFLSGLAFFWIVGLVRPELTAALPMPSMWLVAAGLLMAATGFVDDFLEMNAWVKLAMQCGAAGLLLLGGYRFEIPFNIAAWGLSGEVLSAGITFAWILFVINAVNLMDGLDGLAGGISVMAVLSLAVASLGTGFTMEAVFIAAFVGALIGFLFHNSHPATIFMGDTGSLFLGVMLAGASLPVTANPNVQMAYLIPVLALGLPILDTTVAILRRALEGKGVFDPDKEHIHHRMASRLGLGHASTVSTLYGVALVFGLSAMLIATNPLYPVVALGLSATAVFTGLLLYKLEYVDLNWLVAPFRSSSSAHVRDSAPVKNRSRAAHVPEGR